MYMFVIFFSGHMDNRCLATATFVKEVDDLLIASVVSHAILTVESFHFAILPAPVSTRNASSTFTNQLVNYYGCCAACMEEGE